VVTVLFVGFDVAGLAAVGTLACGARRLLVCSRCGAWRAHVPFCGWTEDTLLLFAGVTTLFVALEPAEFLLDTINSQKCIVRSELHVSVVNLPYCFLLVELEVTCRFRLIDTVTVS
jgi:hypothetical protein